MAEYGLQRVDPFYEKCGQLLGIFYNEGESLGGCIEPYVSMNRFWFAKVRAALGKNQESASNLFCAKMSADGNTCLKSVAAAPGIDRPLEDAPGLVTGPAPEKPKRAQVTYLSKYDDLRQQQPSGQLLASVQDGVFSFFG